MTRRRSLLLLPLLAACARRASPTLPAKVEGWRRGALREVPLPEALPKNLVRRATAADYEGPGRVNVSLYELTSSAAALDAVQRWRATPDTVFFYKDSAFVVVAWRDADRNVVGAFVRALEKQLTP